MKKYGINKVFQMWSEVTKLGEQIKSTAGYKS